jgi:hypothetical protein
MMVEGRRCHRCEAEIAAERLEVLPDTRLCLPCSKEVGGDYVVRVVNENLSKAGSLKKNYGGVSLKKVLREITPKRRDDD